MTKGADLRAEPALFKENRKILYWKGGYNGPGGGGGGGVTVPDWLKLSDISDLGVFKFRLFLCDFQRVARRRCYGHHSTLQKL